MPLTELGIYERRLDRIESGLPGYSVTVGADGLVPTFIDANSLDECLSLLDSTLRRIDREETVLVVDNVLERELRSPVYLVRRYVRSRTLFDYMV